MQIRSKASVGRDPSENNPGTYDLGEQNRKATWEAEAGVYHL